MSQLFYISNHALHAVKSQQSQMIQCQAVDQFKKNLNDIHQRKQWKTQGTGAQFMGLSGSQSELDLSGVYPTDVVQKDAKTLIYSAQLQEGTAIYSKKIGELDAEEGLVLRNQDFITYNMDINATQQHLILSVGRHSEFERHLCILDLNANRVQYLTEGECIDAHPRFNPLNSDQVYYDSCGLSYEHGIDFGPREIHCLNIRSGELDSVCSDPKYDFYKPQMDQNGNLYYLKRPYHIERAKFSHFLKDIVLAPVRIIKAIIGWLDFFTQRYTGESLKNTSGHNPAKNRQKSEEEIFVEGNLIQAQKNLDKNKSAGEHHPGFIPSSWQLMRRDAHGEVSCIKKGVMSYSLHGDAVIYANGKDLIQLNADQTENKLTEAKFTTKIICFDLKDGMK